MIPAWWVSTNGRQLAQGDLLPNCHVPWFVSTAQNQDGSPLDVEVKYQRLIIVTQSCDLENNKVDFVALCPIHTLSEFCITNPHYEQSKNWESVRLGKQHSLHMLASFDCPIDNRQSLVVDFGQIVSLPIDYLSTHAESLETISPFLGTFFTGVRSIFYESWFAFFHSAVRIKQNHHRSSTGKKRRFVSPV